jgi:hypothetical protein
MRFRCHSWISLRESTAGFASGAVKTIEEGAEVEGRIVNVTGRVALFPENTGTLIERMMGKGVKSHVFIDVNNARALNAAYGKETVDKVIEIAIPFSLLELREGEEMRMVVEAREGDRELERYPRHGYIVFSAPTATFDREMWAV